MTLSIQAHVSRSPYATSHGITYSKTGAWSEGYPLPTSRSWFLDSGPPKTTKLFLICISRGGVDKFYGGVLSDLCDNSEKLLFLVMKSVVKKSTFIILRRFLNEKFLVSYWLKKYSTFIG